MARENTESFHYCLLCLPVGDLNSVAVVVSVGAEPPLLPSLSYLIVSVYDEFGNSKQPNSESKNGNLQLGS